MSALRPGVLLVPLLVAACASPERDERRWQRVYEDDNHVVAFDPDNVERLLDGSYLVWYRTDHARPHLRDGKPWTREVTLVRLWCDELRFRVWSVDLSDGDRPPISRQRASHAEFMEQPWRSVAPGTGEEVAARAVCDHARSTESSVMAGR